MVESSVASQRHRAKQVDSRKRTIESRLAEILAELDGMPGAPGLYDSLVDSEVHIFFGDQKDLAQMQLNFVATCRATRAESVSTEKRFDVHKNIVYDAVLHNDLRAAMDELHKLLNEIHNASRSSGTDASPTVSAAVSAEAPFTAPFALVQAVELGSPADTGNLQVGDKVIKFGDAQGGSGLTILQTRLQEYKDTAQTVLVQRKGETVELHITPQSWSGRGLLGGTLVPL